MTGIRSATLGVALVSVGLLLGACASPAAKTAAPAAPTSAAPTAPPAAVARVAPVVAAPVADVAPVVAAPVAQAAPVTAAPTAVPPVQAVAPVSPPPASSVATSTASTPPSATKQPPLSASPDHTASASGAAPHFATPDAAMRYLAAAYNSGDEVAIRHVTTPDSRSDFEAERQWVKTFSFRDCAAMGAPYWTYNCTLDITANMPGVNPNIDATTGLVVMDEVALEVAPAARTGYYVDAVEGCGG
jgi:hypothetical protein